MVHMQMLYGDGVWRCCICRCFMEILYKQMSAAEMLCRALVGCKHETRCVSARRKYLAFWQSSMKHGTWSWIHLQVQVPGPWTLRAWCGYWRFRPRPRAFALWPFCAFGAPLPHKRLYELVYRLALLLAEAF